MPRSWRMGGGVKSPKPEAGSSPTRRRGGRRPAPYRKTPLELEALEPRLAPAGTWTPFAHVAPTGGLGTMMLLSDGSFMAQGGGVSSAWYRLTPGPDGGYATTGTWSSLASMSLQRLYFASNVLPDGRVLILGGEYSGPQGNANWTNTGEIYDPVANHWTAVATYPQTRFGDDPSMALDSGQVLLGYLSGPQTYLYNPATNTYTPTGSKLRNERSDEETWLKLPDGSVLSYDVFNDANKGQSTSQRYVPSSGTWVDAGLVPVDLSSSTLGYELGGATMLPDGRAWCVGATGHTAFYNLSTNSWAAGPDLPNGQYADDAPLCLLTNGHVLLAADGPGPTFNPPTHIYDYDPVANTFTQVDPPPLQGNNNVSAYNCRMLALPDGTACVEVDNGSQLYAYTPGSGPSAAWAPTISAIAGTGGTFTLTGTQLNGVGAGASYGDDAEMDSNYPIVEYLDAAGHVRFARTFGWTSTGVQTGATPVSTNFTLPAGVVDGAYRVQVVANGIASAAALNVIMDSAVNNVTLQTDPGNNGLYDVWNGGTLLGQWAVGSFGSVMVTMTGAGGTVTIKSTPAGVPVNVYGTGASTINVGDSGSLAGIQGPVNLENPTGGNTITLDDSADPNAVTATLHTLGTNASDSQSNADPWGQVTGLAPAAVNFEYADTAGLTIQTGTSAGNVINVQQTGAPTALVGSAAALAVQVGAGTAQGVAGPLTLSGPAGSITLTVDDSTDAVARTAALTPAGLTGLTPAAINVPAGVLASLTLRGGTGNDTFTVGTGSLAALTAPLAINGGTGANTVTLNDSANASVSAYTVTASTLAVAGFGGLTYAGLSSLVLNGGSAGDSYAVTGTAPGTSLTINTGAAADTAALGGGNLDGLAGAVTYNGSGGDSLTIDDSAKAGATTYTVNTSALSRTGAATLTFHGAAQVTLDGSNGADVYNVVATAAATPVTLNGGPATDTFNVSSLTKSLASIQGGVTINGGAGTDVINANDANSGAAQTYQLTNTSLTRGGAAALSYGAVETFKVTAGSGNDSFFALAVPAVTTSVNLGGGSNTLVGPGAANTWQIQSQGGGTLDTKLSFTSAQNLTGGTAADTFKFGASTAAGVSGTIDGGGGTGDALNYASYATGVSVNLLAGTATGAGAVANVNNVTGSTHNDTITGNNAGDMINGNGGADILTGGTGNDTFVLASTQAAGTTVSGGGGADTLAGANTANTWTLTGAGAGSVNGTVSFGGIANLTGGTGADTFKFTGGSVAGTVSGGAGTNTLDYSGNGGNSAAVNLAAGSATSTGGFTGIQKLIGSSSAGDTLTGPNATNAWSITGAGVGTVGSFSFSAVENLVGGTGLDVFKFTSTSGNVASIDGGGAPANQGDWLDYSGLAAAVTVNLAAGSATGVTGSVANVQNVHGGNGGNHLTGNSLGNILIGGTGANTITGGGGRSLLIADAGPSTITGGSGASPSGGDILVAGTTTYDSMTTAHELALMSILAEWKSADPPSTRFADINTGTGGGLNGTNSLNWGVTVSDNGKANTLTAQSGAVAVDWFFANQAAGHTQIFNNQPGDHINNT